MGNLVLIEPAAPPAVLFSLAELSDMDVMRAAESAATRRAYLSDFRIFASWCAVRSYSALPSQPNTIAEFLIAQMRQGIAASTLTRRVAAIRSAHNHADFTPSPTAHELVRKAMRGIKRTIGTRPNKKAPAVAPLICEMVSHVPDTLGGKRDRAMLLVGFAGCMRRSEIVALTVADLERLERGVKVHIRKSKTDQEGRGQAVWIPAGRKLLPVEALDDWLRSAGIAEGPLFRAVSKSGAVGDDALSSRAVANMVKRYVAATGRDQARYSGHSLRSGFLTSAARSHADPFKMRGSARHASLDTTMGYVIDEAGFDDHAGDAFL